MALLQQASQNWRRRTFGILAASIRAKAQSQRMQASEKGAGESEVLASCYPFGGGSNGRSGDESNDASRAENCQKQP
jgi:hypothetical protein